MKSPARSKIELQRLRQVALSIGQVADKVTARCIGLSTEDVRILTALHDSPRSTATEIAKLTLLTPVQVGRRILRLRKLLYLVGEVDCLDARAVRLQLTSEGGHVYERSREITESIQAWAIRDVSSDDWEIFSRILNTLLASVSSADQDSHVSELMGRLMHEQKRG